MESECRTREILGGPLRTIWSIGYLLIYVVVVVVATLDGWGTSLSQNPFGEGVNEILKKCGFSKP